MDQSSKSFLVKRLALEFGFDHVGIAAARPLDDDARRLEAWLHKGLHGSMKYMENHFDLRIDPSKLVPGARSVITVLKNYYPESEIEGPLKISKYAYGQDYHEVIREKLKALLSALRLELGDFEGRGFVDSAPVLERSWALQSGLGWIGKNGNLINKGSGSFFFIATLVTDLSLEPDAPFTGDFCGSCTRCIDACPTEAIGKDRQIQGNKCISYFTIELKDEIIPQEMKGKFGNWMFGCDTCQDVCPWNRFSQPHTEPGFKPLPAIIDLTKEGWKEISEEAFKNLFKYSPLSRSKYKGIKRNIQFLNTD